MATNSKVRTKIGRPKVDPAIQERLQGMASELLRMLSGEPGCPHPTRQARKLSTTTADR